MEKLAEEIWKTTLYSLVVASAVVGLMRYIDHDPWWKISQIPISEESENNPLVYYSIINSNDKAGLNAGLFFMNTLQQESADKHGVFEYVLPGQVLSVRVNISNQTIRSPAFRLQEREIRHLVFAYANNKLEYLGSHSRLRELKFSKALNLETEKLASANVLKVIETYQPIEKAEAKEKAEPKKLRDDNIHNFPGNVNPLTDHFPFDIFLHFR
ncbi:MAG: hypothetical protein V1690_02220 [Candidatus Moraniibacteriota bacterium]